MKLFNGKYKQKFSIIFVLALFIQILLPIYLNYSYAEGSGTNLGDIFYDVELSVDGEEIDKESFIEIKDGTVVELKFKWQVSNDVDVAAGDWAEISLPPAFAFLADATGDLEGADSEVVGTYTLNMSDKKLKVVFNDVLSEKDEKNGFVKFKVEFDLKEFENDTVQVISFNEPINKEFKIILKPGGDNTAISKSGKSDADINAKNINWEIDLNTVLGKVENAIITDKIPEGLELNSGSIEIYNLLVGYEGKRTEGSKVEGITPEITADGFKVTLGEINSAYRIKYSTKIVNYNKASYTNAAKIFNGDDKLGEAASTVNKIVVGSSIEKSGKADKDLNATKVTWTIDINKSETYIENAVLLDTPGSNLSQAENIRIIKLEKSGSSWTEGENKTEYFKGINGGSLAFPISFGNISEVYRIVFDTDINYPALYQEQTVLTNTATIKGGNIEDGEVDAGVTVKRDTLLEKSGNSTVNYEKKEISWTIHVNKAKHNITNAVVSDTFGSGHELVPGSLKVQNSSGIEVVPGEDGFPNKTENPGKDGFTVNLGTINSHYIIKYTTKITNYDQNNFTNNASLNGGGITGPITVSPGKPVTISNSYSKGNASGTFGGIAYDGINYDAKTMSWKITIKPTKEKITELVITDTFPNNGMLILPDTLRVLKGSTVLVKDTHYAVALKDNASHKGFIITFIGASLPLENSDYYIYYKTSFDPDEVLKEDGILNTTSKYINNANFKGKTEKADNSEVEFNVNRPSEYNIISNAFNSGKKEGNLRREAREIDWRVYVNYMSRELKPFAVEDVMTDGQEVMESTIKVIEYSVKANGDIEEKDTELNRDTDYTLAKTENGFTLTFINGIDKPYVIKYTAKIIGISKAQYKNTATVTGGGKYESTVNYNDHDKFIIKEAEDVSGTTVYTDDIIKWKVVINQSLSDIKNAVFTDIISKGLEYVNGSLNVYKGEGAGKERVESTEYDVGNKLLENGDRELKVEFKNEIKAAYTIEYETVVIAIDGNVKNSADFSGDEVIKVPMQTKEYMATQISSGGGSGVSRGKIIITKVDGENEETKLDAEFELFYILNGEERIIGGGKKATTDGVLEYSGLPLRQYYLREVTAPEGFELNQEVITLVLDSTVKLVEETVKNYKLGSITIKKVDEEDNEKVLEGAEFKLLNTATNEEKTLTTDINGIAIAENLPHGNYKLVEVKAPEGYLLDNIERNIVIDNDNIDISFTLTNKKIPPVPIDPSLYYGLISIRKVDSKDETKVLEGAVFEIRDAGGKVVATLTTDDKGVAKVENLIFGEYKIVEVKAPEGYKLDDKEINVLVNLEKKKVELKIINGKEPEKPEEPEEPEKPEEPTKPGEPEDPVIDIGDKTPGGPGDVEPQDPDDKTPSIPDGKLPKTGGIGSGVFYLTGLALVILGVVLKRRTT